MNRFPNCHDRESTTNYVRGLYPTMDRSHQPFPYHPKFQRCPHPNIIEEASVQFKVFAFDCKLRGLDLTSANSIYRFELPQQKPFGCLLNVLRNHGVEVQRKKFYYVDDEQDLVVLSSDIDFKYMLKLLRGRTIKIVCEKITEPCGGNGQFYKRQYKLDIAPQENPRGPIHTGLISNTEEKVKVHPKRCQFAIPVNWDGEIRYRTIPVSELNNCENKEVTKQQEERKIEKQFSPSDLFNMLSKTLTEKRIKPEQTLNGEQCEEKTFLQQEETPLQEQQEESKQKIHEDNTGKLTTSQIISSYLVEEKDTPEEQVSEQEVEYPAVNEEDPSLPVVESKQEFEHELTILSDMGFNDSHDIVSLLKKYNGDLQRTVYELLY